MFVHTREWGSSPGFEVVQIIIIIIKNINKI